jgi:glycosyltransferase involved in cell wall biosynthesis
MSRRKVISGLPVYNGEAYIASAIEGHLSQSFGDFDLVISDNASTDGTGDICREYARRDDRVKYFRVPENRGLLWNHRRVMELIESPDQYFRWAAADDVMEPRLLEAMVAVLDTRPEAVAAAPETTNIDRDGKVIGSAGRTLDMRSPDVYERAWQVLCGSGYQMVIAFGLFRA